MKSKYRVISKTDANDIIKYYIQKKCLFGWRYVKEDVHFIPLFNKPQSFYSLSSAFDKVSDLTYRQNGKKIINKQVINLEE